MNDINHLKLQHLAMLGALTQMPEDESSTIKTAIKAIKDALAKFDADTASLAISIVMVEEGIRLGELKNEQSRQSTV